MLSVIGWSFELVHQNFAGKVHLYFYHIWDCAKYRCRCTSMLSVRGWAYFCRHLLAIGHVKHPFSVGMRIVILITYCHWGHVSLLERANKCFQLCCLQVINKTTEINCMRPRIGIGRTWIFHICFCICISLWQILVFSIIWCLLLFVGSVRRTTDNLEIWKDWITLFMWNSKHV